MTSKIISPYYTRQRIQKMDLLDKLYFFESTTFESEQCDVKDPIDPRVRPAVISRWDTERNELAMEYPAIVINADYFAEPIKINSEHWKFCFEELPHSKMLGPDVHLQVELFMFKSGYVVKGPITLLLFLCQNIYSIEQLKESEINKVLENWAKIGGIITLCESIRSAKNKDGEVISVLMAGLELTAQKVKELVEFISKSDEPSFFQTILGEISIFDYINEIWKIEYIDDQFTGWFPVYAKDTQIKRIAEYRKTTEIYEKIMQKGLFGPKEDTHIEYQVLEFPLKYPLKLPKPPKLETSWDQTQQLCKNIVQELRNLGPLEVPKNRPEIAQFLQFYKDTFNMDITPLAYYNCCLLFHTLRNEQDLFILVKVFENRKISKYFLGLPIMILFYGTGKEGIQFFSMVKDSRIREEEIEPIIDLSKKWLGNSFPKYLGLMNFIMDLRFSKQLSIDLFLGDVLENLYVTVGYYQDPRYSECWKALWKFNEDTEVFIPKSLEDVKKKAKHVETREEKKARLEAEYYKKYDFKLELPENEEDFINNHEWYLLQGLDIEVLVEMDYYPPNNMVLVYIEDYLGIDVHKLLREYGII